MSELLTWNEAVKAMKDEGFNYEIRFDGYHDPVHLGWRTQMGTKYGSVESHNYEPTAAINDLLSKCRERWPAKHFLDDLSLTQLVDVCGSKQWNIFLFSDLGCTWSARIDAAGDFVRGYDAPENALREAMKIRARSTLS